MIFTQAAKTELLAFIETLDPTPEVNPLQAQVDALLDTVQALITERDALVAKIVAAQAALA
jgi:hypothetical protein